MNKKLLFVIWSYSYGGGAERVLNDLLWGLDERGGYDLSLMEVSHFDCAWDPLPPSVEVLTPVVDETASGMSRIRRGVRRRLMRWFPERAAQFFRGRKRYDVTVAFNYQLPSFFLRDDEGTLSWTHSDIVDLLEDDKRRELQRRAYGRADRLFAISERTYDSMVELFPEYKDKTSIVYNGYRFDRMRAKAAEEEGIVFEQPAVLVVGRMDETKDPLRSFEAFKYIHEQCPEAHLYYLGEGNQRAALEARIAEENMGECVHLLGFFDNPYPLIKNATCLLSMSHSEGCQTVFVEALALGVPFISTPAGAAEMLSNEGRFGKVIERCDEAGDAFKALMEASQQEGFVGEAQEFVDRFSLDAQVDAFERLVDEIVKERNA